MSGHLLNKARRDREPWGIWLFVRWLGRMLASPVTRFNRWRRLLRLRRGGVDRSWWWVDRLSFRILKWFTYLLALIFLVWLVRALIVVIDGSADASFLLGFNTNSICVDKSVECGALSGWVTSLLSIALASAVFLLWRLGLMRRRYIRYAARQPKDLVPTAGTIIGRVVGRDQLCRVVMEDLRLRRGRRPHVLVGGVGTGKTAVLVQLTELLAKRHAVPVPIRLRDATELDFTTLARQRFLKELDPRLGSEAEGEKVWRRLLRDGRIVVLADGLEEALADESGEKGKSPDRDTEIRTAIAKAHKLRLPLFVASRPHAPLRGMDATIHELEPLSEVDALSYITENRPSEDDWRLSWIVEMAGVAEAPLYLQITRELSEQDLLDDIVGREEQVLHSYTHDQSTLRLRLLETWEKALIYGRLYPQVALGRAEREATLDWISALACIVLKNDRLVVSLDEQVPQSLQQWIRRDRPEPLVTPGRHSLSGIDARLAAVWGDQLGLVEVIGDSVRFEHSLIEAYLGSRLLTRMFSDKYWAEALGQTPDARDPSHPRPGREFLIALVLYSRRGIGGRSSDGRHPEVDQQAPQVRPEEICERLMAAGRAHVDNKALDIYAAALEIASAPDRSAVAQDQPEPTITATEVALRRHPALQATEIDIVTTVLPSAQDAGACGIRSLSGMGAEIRSRWAGIQSADLETLEEAKIGLICRFGDALRTLGDSARGDFGHLGYQELYEICCVEDSYRVRLAGAQEIGRGGCAAYEELRGLLDPGRIGERPSGSGRQRRATTSPPGTGPWAWQVSAWLLPLLTASTQEECREQSHQHDQHARLEDWLNHLRPAGLGRAADSDWPAMSQEMAHALDRCPDQDWLSISEEIALAQGFKYAANLRHHQLHSRPEAWSYLESKALEMLRDASYWFSELTLIQALTLWAMPEGDQMPGERRRRRRHDSAHSLPSANPDQTVERWLDIVADKESDRRDRSSRRVHPFVEAAADMANRALAVRRPGRFLWMDESDVVSRVGAGLPKLPPSSARRPRLWIPPSMGWSALDPEAQQLLADVLLLLNLTERGDTAHDAEGRLRRASRHDLPPCLTKDRRPLRPLLTVGRAGVDRRGDSCLDGCKFQLCPYPPKGLQHHRTELSEEFCRRQYRLVRRYLRPLHLRRRTARWQGMTAGRLRVFWMQMAERARNGSAV